jgi:hypothetical protein
MDINNHFTSEENRAARQPASAYGQEVGEGAIASL